MRKFEIYPYINNASVGEVLVTVKLNDEEIESIRNMSEKEFSDFIKSKAVVVITDADVDYDAETFSEWNEVIDD